MRTNSYSVILKGRDDLGPKRRLEDNIKMGFRKIGREIVDWILLAQDRAQWGGFINTLINFRAP
jgi:hypothetical protein